MALEITIKGGPVLAITNSASDRSVVALLPMPAILVSFSEWREVRAVGT